MVHVYDSRESILGAINNVLTSKQLTAEVQEQVIEDSFNGGKEAKHAWPTSILKCSKLTFFPRFPGRDFIRFRMWAISCRWRQPRKSPRRCVTLFAIVESVKSQMVQTNEV